jgi:Tol biopolymer transport system component
VLAAFLPGGRAPATEAAPPTVVFEAQPSPRAGTELYSVGTDGTRLVRLTDNRVSEHHPAWSPDGAGIAFGRYPRPFEGLVELWVMDADGSDETMLTDIGYGDPWFDWSPDGSQIVFAGREEGAAGSEVLGDSDLYVVDVESHAVERLGGSEWADFQPAWAPDGRSIAWSANGAVYVMDADGSELRELVDESAEPRWSPDSASIAFESWRDDYADPEFGAYTWELYVRGADGTGERRLTRHRNAQNGEADWRPDGEWIVYSRWFDDDVRADDSDLFVKEIGATTSRRLTFGRGSERYPRWTPDGEAIVYQSGGDLWITSFDGRRTRLLTPGPRLVVGEVVDVQPR